MSVTAPLLVPFSNTVAPMRGPSESTTVPDTLFDCCTSVVANDSFAAAATCGVAMSPNNEHNPTTEIVFLEITYISFDF